MQSTSHSSQCHPVGGHDGPSLLTPSPNKRARISNPSPPTTTTNDDANYNFDDEEEEWERASLHYLKATLVGVYCASCTHQPLLKKRGSNLWVPHNTKIIRHHWKNNQCYTGCMPNAGEVTRMLISQQVLLHSHLKNNNADVRQGEVEKLFPKDSPQKEYHFCSRCGHFAKKITDMMKHYGSSNKQCKSIHLKRGPVLQGRHGFQCPSYILEQIQLGNFTLPYSHGESIINISSPPPSMTTAPPTVATMPSTQQLDNSIFSASSSQMARAMSLSPQRNVSIQSEKFAASIHCFINHLSTSNDDSFAKSLSLQRAYQHQSLLLTVIDIATSPQQCGSTFLNLSKHASAKYDSERDDPSILIVIQAAKMYLDTGAANFDVLRLSALFRGMLYQVGVSDGVINEEMMLQGSTFVPSKKMKYLLQELEALILFVLRTNPGLISTQVKQASQIHSYVIDNFSQMDEHQLASEAATRLIDTNAIYGMMLSILLEQSDRLKPNTLQLFLVGRSIKSVQNSTHLDFYQSNLISKRCNTLLRLMRHFVCGHIVNSATQHPTESSFATASFLLIKTIQTCTSVDATCRAIRMAKEIDSKSPSKVKKAFDPDTGEVMVEGLNIERNVWQVAIPEMAKKMKQHLLALFHVECHGLILTILDTRNKLVISVDECYVYKKGECHCLLSWIATLE